MSSCSAHCSYYTGWDAQGSKAPLAVVVLAVLESAERRVTGEAVEPEDWKGEVTDSELSPVTGPVGSGAESQDAAGDAVAVDVAGAGPDGEPDAVLSASDDAADGGMAVASRAPCGGDACSQKRA
jgi:hypothetical protein